LERLIYVEVLDAERGCASAEIGIGFLHRFIEIGAPEFTKDVRLIAPKLRNDLALELNRHLLKRRPSANFAGGVNRLCMSAANEASISMAVESKSSS
jgi:hypothetical protein